MLSIVIPVFNENQSLSLLHGQLAEVAECCNLDFEIVIVDDGSTDSSWRVIETLAEKDSRVSGIRLRRNFGKAAALSAALQRCRGDIVITLDADLQDDPKEIPRFLARLEEGYDVVSGWKQKRYDPWHKVIPSRCFNWMVSWMTGVRLHDHNCGFKLYRRKVFDEVRLYGELHRFVPVLAAARGWRVCEIVVEHRRREFGRSKYGLSRIPKGFLDLLTVKFLTGFGNRPAHLLGMLGLVGFFVGGVGIVILTGWWFLSRMTEMTDLHLHQRAIFYYSLACLLLGSQFMSVGFLAELFTASDLRRDDGYSIRETVGAIAADPPLTPRSQDQHAHEKSPSPSAESLHG